MAFGIACTVSEPFPEEQHCAVGIYTTDCCKPFSEVQQCCAPRVNNINDPREPFLEEQCRTASVYDTSNSCKSVHVRIVRTLTT